MDLDRAPRLELLKTIEKQKELLQRRESKLRDVVTAYKGLVKENEALEASMKVMSAAQARNKRLDVPHSKGPASDSASDRGQESEYESEDGGVGGGQAFVDPLNISNSDQGVSREDVDELQTEVETLSSSVLTLTEEKSKLEASYIAEKKLIKQENEELQREVEKQRQQYEVLGEDLRGQLHELKVRVRGQQIEREKEQTDHAVMLRELQRLLASERQTKEQIEHQCDEATFNLQEKDRLLPDLVDRHEKQVVCLRREVADLKQELAAQQERAKEPSPMLIGLQRETAELKAQHRLQVQQDLYHVQDAEEKVKVASQQSETRISELETKLADLAESVGNYERLRYQDQQTIIRLKDRVSQLDLENTSLARVSQGGVDQDGDNLDTTDIQTLVDRIVKLKSQLKLINQESERPVNIEELLIEADVEPEFPLVRKYREELEQVHDEFERYRLRAQSVLKNKKEQTPSKEEDHLKEHLADLREKLRTMHVQQDEETAHYKQREDHLRQTLLSMQEKHKRETSQMQGEHHTQLQEFEDEIKKQRDRTISMLAEKDREIEHNRAATLHSHDADYMVRYRAVDMGGASSERQTSEDDAVRRLLAAPPSGQSEMTLLYFSQEQARKDVEITTLRKQKRELETALRELQLSSGMKQEQFNDDVDRLKEEIRKLERSITREDANLEYLKNVTYKFLICSDAHGKQQMLNAITTILQFSPREKSSVQAHSKGWWAT